MIGNILGDRFEILERVGGGGMATVYKAHDHRLDRKVAVKILRQQFVHDEDFIRRFQREAQAAASLSHPNVVSIYDVGQQDDVHYIVMEYVEGCTLNEKIKEQAPLPVEEAVHIASQICDALEHAHYNQIIHRDIKPHNILLSKDGRVKVTDFGIARAAAATDLTQTGAVLGSVHYFSPEQAKGVIQGEKSDLYSLGIVLYQMLTNRLPFLGESPISVALKHLQEHVEEPRKINPLIPQSVENIILKALRKTPEERYNGAKDMLEDLTTCLLPHRRDEEKLMFVDEDDDEKTIIMPALRGHQTTAPNGGEETMVASPPHYERTEREPRKKPDSFEDHTTSRPWLKPVILSSLTVILLIGMWFGVKSVKNMLTVPEVEVPEVVGMTLEDAVAELERMHLNANPILEEYSSEVEEGIVMDQTESNITVRENSNIGLTVSLGVELSVMEPYIGKKWEDVQEEIQALVENSNQQISIKQEHNEASSGTIIEQIPAAGERFNPAEVEMVITLSEGPETFQMPDLENLTLSEAQNILLKNNLELDDDIQYETDFVVEKDRVLRQFPYDPGELVSPGEMITLIVSSGLPENALQTDQTVQVDPAEDAPSQVRIVVSDARGKDNEVIHQEISTTTAFLVRVVVVEGKNATITVYRDDILYDSWTVTYNDVRRKGEDSNVLSQPQSDSVDQSNEQDEDNAEDEASEENAANEDLEEP